MNETMRHRGVGQRMYDAIESYLIRNGYQVVTHESSNGIDTKDLENGVEAALNVFTNDAVNVLSPETVAFGASEAARSYLASLNT